MKIVVFETEPWERPTFDAIEEDHDLVFVDGALTGDDASEHADAEIVSTFIYSELDAEVLGALPRLRMIATRSTGFDHIDAVAVDALVRAIHEGKVAAAGLDVLPFLGGEPRNVVLGPGTEAWGTRG